mmetsp:Transcript_43520/g.107652  ORF Transcript_43520/g.107652 Transcript_43520/m.107652 type:complete len:420 (+) Transcript_43520:86-1345(+)
MDGLPPRVEWTVNATGMQGDVRENGGSSRSTSSTSWNFIDDSSRNSSDYETIGADSLPTCSLTLPFDAYAEPIVSDAPPALPRIPPPSPRNAGTGTAPIYAQPATWGSHTQPGPLFWDLPPPRDPLPPTPRAPPPAPPSSPYSYIPHASRSEALSPQALSPQRLPVPHTPLPFLPFASVHPHAPTPHSGAADYGNSQSTMKTVRYGPPQIDQLSIPLEPAPSPLIVTLGHSPAGGYRLSADGATVAVGSKCIGRSHPGSSSSDKHAPVRPRKPQPRSIGVTILTWVLVIALVGGGSMLLQDALHRVHLHGARRGPPDWLAGPESSDKVKLVASLTGMQLWAPTHTQARSPLLAPRQQPRVSSDMEQLDTAGAVPGGDAGAHEGRRVARLKGKTTRAIGIPLIFRLRELRELHELHVGRS